MIKTALKSKNKFGGLALSDFKTYRKAVIIRHCDIDAKTAK